jgi:hypothetical protein
MIAGASHGNLRVMAQQDRRPAAPPRNPSPANMPLASFQQFGVTIDLCPNPTLPASDMSAFFRFLPGTDTGEYHHYFHTDLETPQTVPWTGLEATTRAYAKIIDEKNKLPLGAFRRLEEPARTS